MLHFLLNIAIDAYFYGNESVIEQRKSNECLIANKCESVYDSSTNAWIVRLRTEKPDKKARVEKDGPNRGRPSET